MPAGSNDNSSHRPEPDAHGQAALLLVESLIHVLIERSVISLVEGIEIVKVAADVSRSIREDLGGESATNRLTIVLLETIATSLSADLMEA